jgi:hypothetical protein
VQKKTKNHYGSKKIWDEEEQEEQQAGEPEGVQQDERHVA